VLVVPENHVIKDCRLASLYSKFVSFSEVSGLLFTTWIIKTAGNCFIRLCGD
jgi:hypothetical protein